MLARLGIDKYRAVKEGSPADAVKGFIQNLLPKGGAEGDMHGKAVVPEKSPDEVVIQATYIHAERYDATRDTKPLKGESQKDLEKWLACWERMEIMDVHLWPLWEKEVHDILHPLFKELQLIFLAYTRSISEDSAEDAMEMSMDEFHDFVVDVGLETKTYTFDVMCNQFIKANATNTAQVRAQRQEEKRDAQSRGGSGSRRRRWPRRVRRAPHAARPQCAPPAFASLRVCVVSRGPAAVARAGAPRGSRTGRVAARPGAACFAGLCLFWFGHRARAALARRGAVGRSAPPARSWVRGCLGRWRSLVRLTRPPLGFSA